MSVFKNVRVVVGLCIFFGISAATVVGWTTGFFGQVVQTVVRVKDEFTAWLNQPIGLEHMMAGAGVLLIPIAILVVIFAVADG